ncbi:MAG: ABC transporter substrate-binding protein [Lachnospiraceae bacterium]|jgi:ribose transport system substrate-binding protein
MKRTILGILILSLAAGLVSGCSPQSEVHAEKVLQEEVDQEQDEETEVTEEAIETVEASAETAKEEPDLTMRSIWSESGIDYTSAEGLALEAGSKIAVVAGSKNSYWMKVREGMEQAIKDLNTALGYTGGNKIELTFDAPADGMDVDAQINMIDTVLDENPTVLCLAAIDQNSCQAQLETAFDNEIPVVMLDSGVHSDLFTTTCQTDNYAAGGEAARRLSEAIGGIGKIAIMAHVPTAQTSADREQGFRDEIQANYPQITLLPASYENEETSVADMAREVIEANPDLNAYFCTTEDMAVQVLEVLKNYPDRDIKVVSFDAGAQQVKAVKEGREAGVIVQNPFGMGYATIIAAARSVLGLSNDAFIDTGYQWLDASNIDDVIYQNYLYE